MEGLAAQVGKKINPRRRPVNRAEIDKLLKQSATESVRYCWTVMFSVLLDKHGAKAEDLQQLWNEVEELVESINMGYVNLADLRRVLREEYDIEI